MKVVLDTNVLASGYFWLGPSSKIVAAIAKQKLEVAFSAPIIAEYHVTLNALSAKYRSNGLHRDIKELLEKIETAGELVTPLPIPIRFSRDPDDDKFIFCAMAARAHSIITGDKDLLVLANDFETIQIMKPADFVLQHLSENEK